MEYHNRKSYYMSDNYKVTGTSYDELVEEADNVDRHTEITCCNFSNGEILHYNRVHKKDEFYCVKLMPHCPLQIDTASGGIYIKRNVILKTSSFHDEECIVLEDLLDKRSSTIFHLPGSFPNSKLGLVFTSSIAKKTMVPRLMKYDITDDCLERDILMAKIIGTSKEDIIKYIVCRKSRSGRIRKMFSMFAGDPHRMAFRDAVQIVAAAVGKHIHKWQITNISGMEATFYCPEIKHKIQSIFPNIKYFPVISVIVCDTGYVSNQILFGWICEENEFAVPFYTHSITVSSKCVDQIDMYRKEIDKRFDYFMQDANVINHLQVTSRCLAADAWERQLNRLVCACIRGVNGGKQSEKSFLHYAENNVKTNSTYEMFEIFLNAINDNNIYTDYGSKRIRTIGVAKIFKCISAEM